MAIFRVLKNGELERTGLISTGGKFPRHFTITPCDKAVLVANQDSSHVRLFRRDTSTQLYSFRQRLSAREEKPTDENHHC